MIARRERHTDYDAAEHQGDNGNRPPGCAPTVSHTARQFSTAAPCLMVPLQLMSVKRTYPAASDLAVHLDLGLAFVGQPVAAIGGVVAGLPE